MKNIGIEVTGSSSAEKPLTYHIKYLHEDSNKTNLYPKSKGIRFQRLKNTITRKINIINLYVQEMFHHIYFFTPFVGECNNMSPFNEAS